MRSCIYCGRELEKGEVCNCAGAAARRTSTSDTSNNSQSNTTNQTNYNNYNTTNNTTNNTYHTGYTERENPVKRAWERRRTKATARKNSRGNYSNRGVWELIKRVVFAPVDAVSNPGYISKATALVISMISGAIINLCLYFLRTGAIRSPFGIVLSLITINPLQSYSNLFYIITSIISGAIAGILMFFVFAGTFSLISKFVFKQRIQFWELAPRFSLTVIPLVLTSVIGILFGTLSSTSLAILIICGLVGMVILTYEALRTVLIAYPPNKVMYATILGFLIVGAVICYMIRLSI